MMPLKQNIPIFRTSMPPFQHAFAALVQDDLPGGPAKSVGACVNRVLQDVRYQLRRCRDKAEGRLAYAFGQLDLFLPEPKLDLPGTAKLTKFGSSRILVVKTGGRNG